MQWSRKVPDVGGDYWAEIAGPEESWIAVVRHYCEHLVYVAGCENGVLTRKVLRWYGPLVPPPMDDDSE